MYFAKILFSIVFLSFLRQKAPEAASSICNQEDYRYEFTECDAFDNRWRVAVPKKSPATCSGGFVPELPTKAVNCTFACDLGMYLDIKAQQCARCPNGTYSTGGGLRHDDFTKLPDGFAIANEDASMQFYADMTGDSSGESINCSSGGWQTREDGLLVYIPTPCASMLSYSVRLVRPGELKYIYLYPDSTDVLFSFHVQNEQCMASDAFYRRSTIFPAVTPEGKWRMQTVKLKSGQSVVTWKAVVLHGVGQPIYIRQIDISGLPFSGQCTTCPKGTFSQGFTSVCTPCSPGSYAPSKGSSSCTLCDQESYSGSRAASCEKRPSCRPADYYKVYGGSCDAGNGRTSVTYKWVQPKICTETGGVRLPSNEPSAPCPPCNPGTKLENGTCVFCPADYFSNGRSSCEKCPANTAPNYGYYFTVWHRMPSSLKAECQPMDDLDRNACNDVDGWIPMGNRISTGRVGRQDLYLSLLLDVPKGFRDVFAETSGASSSSDSADPNSPIAHVTFTFETKCSGGCGLLFIEQLAGERDALIVDRWNGTWKNISYTYAVVRPTAVTYGWIFIPYDGTDDEASIYSILVDNVVGGGAFECRPCPIVVDGGKSGGGCVSCPTGHYMTADTRLCVQCPNDTYLNVTRRVGIEACVNCGLNLRSMGGGAECGVGDCRFNVSDRVYDLSPLKGFHQARGVPIFGREGSRYVHVVNVSVCSGSGKTDRAMCTSTITEGLQVGALSVGGTICRTTAFPQEKGTIYANPLVLADQLIGVTDDPSAIVEGVNVSIVPLGEWKWRQLYFVYRLRASDSGVGTLASKNCPKGRGAVLVFRCDPAGGGGGAASSTISSIATATTPSGRNLPISMTLPPACPDGTCDGCFYAMIVTSPHACPRCGPADYKRIVGECRDGKQAIHYIPNTRDCVPMADDEQRHNIEHVACSLLTFQIRMVIVGSVVMCAFLVALIIYVWKKNKRLEYKYMKLVESSGPGKDGELPSVETCGLQEDEGEDEDHAQEPTERVVFAKGAWFRRKPSQRDRKGFSPADLNGGDDSTALAAQDEFEDA